MIEHRSTVVNLYRSPPRNKAITDESITGCSNAETELETQPDHTPPLAPHFGIEVFVASVTNSCAAGGGWPRLVHTGLWLEEGVR